MPAGCIESAYIFPGIGLGTLVSRATRLRDDMLLAAAETLASLVTDGAPVKAEQYWGAQNMRAATCKHDIAHMQ